jgi:hypothetical protein
MRAILGIIIAGVLAIAGPSSAQMGLMGAGGSGPARSGGACSQATNFLNRTSGLSGTETTAYTNLICGLVTDGIITGTLSGATGCGTVLDALYIFATNTTTTANLNICGTSFGLTATAAPTFAADHGYTGNGSTQYLITGFSPFSAGGNYAQNSASIGVYVITSRTTAAAYAEMGASDGGNGVDMFPLYTGSVLYNEMNANSTSVAAPANAQGMYVGSRTAVSAVTTYRDGTSFASFGTTSVSMPSVPIWIGADDSGGGTGFSADQISAAFIGAGLNSTQAAAISSRINAYMTALGINVY